MKLKKLLSFILMAAMAISILPTFTITASAATAATEKNITLATSALSGCDSTSGYKYVYYGVYQQNEYTPNVVIENPQEDTVYTDSDNDKTEFIYRSEKYYKYEPIKWRVLSKIGNSTTTGTGTTDTATYKTADGSTYTDNALFMLSENTLFHTEFYGTTYGNAWLTSNLRNKMQNDIFSDDSAELKYVLKTTKTDSSETIDYLNPYINTQYSIAWAGSSLSEDTLFALSAREVEQYLGSGENYADRASGNADFWWLRSPYAIYDDIAGRVHNDGFVHFGNGDKPNGVRPAFNLDSSKILFTSAAKDGKKTDNVGTILANGTNTSDEYKLTMLDTDRDFEVTQTTVKGNKGETITLGYKNAKKGSNEYVSAMIVDETDGEVLYYGQGEKTETSTNSDGTANGTAQFKLPDEIANKEYTLYVFNEQINGDYKTDYSSVFETVTLNVEKPTPPDLDLTVPNPILPEGCEWNNETDGILTLKNVTLGTIKLPEYDMVSGSVYSVIKINISGEVTVDSVIGTKLNTLRFEGEDNNSKMIVNNSIGYDSIEGNVIFESINAKVGNILGNSTNSVRLRVYGGSKVTITGNNGNAFYIEDVFINGTSSFTLDGAKIGFSTSSALDIMIQRYLKDDTGYSAYEDNGVYYLYYGGNPVTKDTFYNYQVVVFDANGGSPALVEQRVIYGNKPVKPVTPVRNGYIFENWYLQLELDGDEIPFDFNSPLTDTSGYYKVKAHWKRDLNAKTIDKVISFTPPVKNAVPQRNIETAEYTATVFWSPEIAEGNTFAKDTEYTATITITTKENYTTADIAKNEYKVTGAYSVTNAAESNIVTAVFPRTAGSSVTRYAVKFDTGGGSTIAKQSVTKNSKATEPKAPTKDGYIFEGWYTDSAFTAEYDFDTKVTKNITLYAKWAEDEIGQPSDDNKDDEQKPNSNKWENPFTDVSENDWFFENVRYAKQTGLMSGITNTEFAPNEGLTRAMLVTILYRLDGEPAVNKSIPFADVTADSYYRDAVIWAEQNGIVSGIGETEFAPDENITREQIAVILYKYAQYKGYDVTQGGMQIREFEDFENISDYAMSAMTWAVNTGLMKGTTEGELKPKDSATRAEIAAILQRFIQNNK